MNEFEDLEKQLNNIAIQIETIKKEAKEKDFPHKLNSILCNLGRYTDWGGGEYHFDDYENNLKIYKSSYTNYFRVDYQDKQVLSCQYSSHDIYIYVKGDWEALIDELFIKSIEVQEQKRLKSLSKKVKDLKNQWNLP